MEIELFSLEFTFYDCDNKSHPFDTKVSTRSGEFCSQVNLVWEELNTDKREKLGVHMPPIEESLRRVLENYKNSLLEE